MLDMHVNVFERGILDQLSLADLQPDRGKALVDRLGLGFR